MNKIWILISALLLSACMGMPDSVEPVSGFEPEKYLGTWYEIARLDHSFERGLSQVTAEYSFRDDGSIRVLNRGFSEAENRWKEATGRAHFVNASDEGYLKVSFFGPFYGSYVIFELDHQNYEYAFVSGASTKYLWLLARKTSVEPAVLQKFVDMSAERGFDTQSLIYVEHDQPLPEGE